jgi:hypothetical protein
VNDVVLVEDVWNQGEPEQCDCREREPQRNPPQVNVALRTELGRAPRIRELMAAIPVAADLFFRKLAGSDHMTG